MLIGIAAIVTARYLSLNTGFSLISKITAQKTITLKEQLMLSAGGTRGALVITLDFLLLETLNYWRTI